jgi:hypothetical protein
MHVFLVCHYLILEIIFLINNSKSYHLLYQRDVLLLLLSYFLWIILTFIVDEEDILGLLIQWVQRCGTSLVKAAIIPNLEGIEDLMSCKETATMPQTDIASLKVEEICLCKYCMYTVTFYVLLQHLSKD